MAGPLNNPKVAVTVDEYRDLMISWVSTPPDHETERCCHCLLAIGVCECIPGERSILDDDTYTVIDAEFEPVS